MLLILQADFLLTICLVKAALETIEDEFALMHNVVLIDISAVSPDISRRGTHMK